MPKTSFLPPQGISQQAAFDIAQNIIKDTPALAAALSGNVSLASFCPEVSLASVSKHQCRGTDAFVQNFVAKKCRAIIDDVEKLDSIQDGFIHYQLLRFCQATTRLQYLNCHILQMW